MEPITRFGLEFNPFLKNAKDIPINTQESREAAFRLDYLAKNKGLASLPALPEEARPRQSADGKHP